MMGTINDALESMSKAIAADPAKAKAKAAPATARLLEGLQCEVTGPRGEKLLTDMPPAMGGAAAAPNPGWFFRGSLASCTATLIAMRAARRGVHLRVLEVTVDSDSDHRGILGLDEAVPAGFTALRMRVKIGADGAELRSLVEWGEAHSPVTCTVRDAPPRRLEIEIA